jgi:hypothetical protein
MTSPGTLRKREEEGLCRCCGKPAKPGFKRCPDCLDKDKLRSSEWRKEHPRFYASPERRSLAREWGRKYRQRNQERRKELWSMNYSRRKILGICTRCPNPAEPGMTLCSGCREKRGRYLREYEKSETRIRKNREKVILYQKKIRDDVLRHYGGKCFRCGLEDLDLLLLHHSNGDGFQHRQKTKTAGGFRFYRRLQKDGYPEGLQVLCRNCHVLAHRELREWKTRPANPITGY